jgi:hypothetical protein
VEKESATAADVIAKRSIFGAICKSSKGNAVLGKGTDEFR